MDKTAAIKMLAGTLARGIMWGAGLAAAKAGVDAINQSTAEAIAYFVASLAVAGIAAWWSSRKDKLLLATQPPAK